MNSMNDGNYNKTYLLPGTVFREEIKSDLEFILKDKAGRIISAGCDLLIEIPPENFYIVVKELKENPRFRVNIFGSINAYRNNKRDFLLVNLRSSYNELSLLLKIEVPENDIEASYIEAANILEEFYRAAAFYKGAARIQDSAFNINIPPGILDGLDCFDINIYAEEDEIKEACINTDISRVLNYEFFKNMRIHNLIAVISRFDWKAGIFPEICLCSAIEGLLQLKLTKRAQYIRMLLCELYRISNHIYFILNICSILQHDIAYALCHLERERVLRFIETITGSRVIPNFVRIGGVKKDVEEEILVDIRKNLPLLFENMRRIEKIIMDDFLVIERLKNIGMISKDIALEYGVTGPNLRASGVRNDLRKDKDYISYSDFSFAAPVGRAGDCLERVLIRFREIFQSIKLVNQIVDNFPEGDYIKKINLPHLEFQPGVISQDIECPHGIFKICMEVGERNIDSLIIKGPSFNSLILGEEAIRGERLEDISLILASLDISPGEIISTYYNKTQNVK